MIKARIGTILVLGIDANNVERMKRGSPLHMHKSECDNGEPIETIIVTYGETLQAIVEDFKRHDMLPPDFVMPVVKPSTKQ